jgi:hypothetical protein
MEHSSGWKMSTSLSADGALANLAQHGLEAGERPLDPVEVRTFRRKEAQGCTGCFDLLLHGHLACGSRG